MDTQTRKPTAGNEQPGWKTEEYHGKQIHVSAQLRADENAELSGPGSQWDFTVKITEKGAGPMAEKCVSAQSDPGLFYSTQAIAEDMGFIKGRELIDGT